MCRAQSLLKVSNSTRRSSSSRRDWLSGAPVYFGFNGFLRFVIRALSHDIGIHKTSPRAAARHCTELTATPVTAASCSCAMAHGRRGEWARVRAVCGGLAARALLPQVPGAHARQSGAGAAMPAPEARGQSSFSFLSSGRGSRRPAPGRVSPATPTHHPIFTAAPRG